MKSNKEQYSLLSNKRNNEKESNKPFTNEIKNEEKAQKHSISIKDKLGFEDFASTKHKSHKESDLSFVFFDTKNKIKCRQYMNRRSGYNKLLDKV